MESKIVELKTPAAAEFARSVRMLAANLAVVCGLSIDDVEDVRMAAEEGFVYACATDQDFCDILFAIDEAQIQMTFSLGPQRDVEDAYERTARSTTRSSSSARSPTSTPSTTTTRA